jgi:ABC-type branched-subunit amino acid transport system ATPase component
MMRTLTLREVLSGYGAMRIVNGVNLEIRQGEKLALLGTNGSGKSTMLKTIMGLATMQGGSIEWNGQNISGLATWARVRSGLGYLPQVRNIFPSLTTAENLILAIRGAAPRHDRHRHEVREAYDIFPELAKLAKVMAGKLSGGERRMLALAATLLQEPQMLILDEPMSDLAPIVIDKLWNAINGVVEAKEIPLLIVEQDVGRALRSADRICIMRRGSIVLDRPARTVSEAEIISTFLEHSQAKSDTYNWEQRKADQ